MPVVPGPRIHDTGGRGAKRRPQPGLTVGRFHVVHVRPVTERHDPAQELVFSRHDILGRLPPDHPGSDAAKLGTHALSLAHDSSPERHRRRNPRARRGHRGAGGSAARRHLRTPRHAQGVRRAGRLEQWLPVVRARAPLRPNAHITRVGGPGLAYQHRPRRVPREGAGGHGTRRVVTDQRHDAAGRRLLREGSGADAAADHLFREASGAPAGQRRADALGLLAETATPFDGVLEADSGATYVSAETSQRLACDASIIEMRHDGSGSVLDVGRKTRTVPWG